MKNTDIIADYFCSGISDKKTLGMEIEHFVCDENLNMIPYGRLDELMKKIAAETGGRLYFEEEAAIGLKYDKYAVSLEPAGQVEISIAPMEKIEDIEKIYSEFYGIWNEKLKKDGYSFLYSGVFPTVETGECIPDDFPLIPKKRYEYMDKYFRETGKYGRHMMRATASTQVSIDYNSYEDAVRKIRVLETIVPILALIAENRCGLGKTEDFPEHLIRNYIWNDTDPDRCGYFTRKFSNDRFFEEYAEYIYEKPVILVTEGKNTTGAEDKSAKDITTGKQIEFTEHLLSMFFPHIRLKKYIEIRVADSMPPEKAMGYAALIKGLMYSEKSLAALEAIFDEGITENDIKSAENMVMKDGWDAEVYGKPAKELIAEIYAIAEESLDNKEREYLKNIRALPLIEYDYLWCTYGDEEKHIQSAIRQKEYIMNSTAKYHNRVVRTMYMPKIFSGTETKLFSEAVCTLFGIFDKVIDQYTKSESYRRLFGFDSITEELILRENIGYSRKIPMARVDIFYNEQTKDFGFCEFNTDGSSAMNEDRELNTALKLTEAYKFFEKKYEITTFELFDTWVEEFLKIYAEFAENKGKTGVPNVVITDFLDRGTVNEFEIFRSRFEKVGINCEICDIRDIKYDGEKSVTPSGMVIDAIYRRAVTSDILSDLENVGGFIDGVKNGNICLIGDFRTQIVHNKILFKILHLPETAEFLSEKERRFIRAHVPYTVSLTQELFEKREDICKSVLEDKNSWIIKPEDSYGSYGVHAGVECDKIQWREFVEECIDKGYILQKFCTPYRLPNVDMTNEKGIYRCKTANLTGLFVYNGKFSGIYSRVSYDEMISTQYNEMTVATVIVK